MDRTEYIKRQAELALDGVEGLVGVLLLGSVSAGMDDEDSDYDVQIIVTDEALEKHPEYIDLMIDLDRKADIWTTTLGELKAYDRRGTDIPELLHAVYIMDPDGLLRETVDALIRCTPEEQRALIPGTLDAYYNAVFRSLKSFRRGFTFGGYQMAASSMDHFTEVLWAVNGFVKPYMNRVPYLLHTLTKLPFSEERTRELIERIAKDADIPSQIALLDCMLDFMAENGYKKVQDDWEGVLEAEADRHRA